MTEPQEKIGEMISDYRALYRNCHDCDGSQPQEEYTSAVLAFYDKNAEKYNETHDPSQSVYMGPRHLAEAIERYVRNKEAKIIDVGCGSGIVGNELTMLGFENIDGLDPCTKLLQITRERHIYQKIYDDYLGRQSTGYLQRQYDVACACGLFCPGHVPTSALREIIQMVKPGGYAIILMNEKHLENPYFKDYSPLDFVGDAYRENLVDQVTITRTKGYFTDKKHSIDQNGLLLVFKVL